MRHGVTLVEIMIVLTLISILVSIALPRFGTVTSSMHIRSAKQAVAAYLVQTRAIAIKRGRTASFIRSGNVVSVEVTEATGIVVAVSPRDLGRVDGVSLSMRGDTISFDPRGMAVGLAGGIRAVVVTNGTARDSVCVVGLGRIAASRCSL